MSGQADETRAVRVSTPAADAVLERAAQRNDRRIESAASASVAG